MNKNILVMERAYTFESFIEVGEDIMNAWEYGNYINNNIKKIPGEFTGTMKVTVEYILAKGETYE
jgi:hypothetical protein